MHLTLTIPYNIPSQNQREHMHWSKQAAERQRVQALIRSCGGSQAALVAQRLAREPQHARLQIASLRTRLIDQSNLWGGAKGLIDALKQQGLLVEDSPKWLTITSLAQTLGDWSNKPGPHGRRTRRQQTVIRLDYGEGHP